MKEFPLKLFLLSGVFLSKTGSEKNKSIVVGLSGRIDSCVCAFLLKKQGYDVKALGVTFIGPEDRNSSIFRESSWFIPSLNPLKRFCDSLGIDFYGVDCHDEFQSVIEKLVDKRLQGLRTYPKLMMNQVLFRVLYEKMLKLGCDELASAHFAKVHQNHQSNEFFLHRSNEKNSDQALELLLVPQNILARTLFPLSELGKEEVKKIAKNFQLKVPFSSAPQSVDALDEAQFQRFVEERVAPDLRPAGKVFMQKSATPMGDHQGIHRFYPGQNWSKLMGGSQLNREKSLFVVSILPGQQEVFIGEESELSCSAFEMVRSWFLSQMDLSGPSEQYLITPHANAAVPVLVYPKVGDCFAVQFLEGEQILLAGDVVVFVNRPGGNAKVLGHGEVARRGTLRPLSRVAEFDQGRDRGKREDPEINAPLNFF